MTVGEEACCSYTYLPTGLEIVSHIGTDSLKFYDPMKWLGQGLGRGLGGAWAGEIEAGGLYPASGTDCEHRGSLLHAVAQYVVVLAAIVVVGK